MKITKACKECKCPQTGLFFSLAVHIDPTDKSHIKSTKIRIPFNTISYNITHNFTINELALSSLEIHR